MNVFAAFNHKFTLNNLSAYLDGELDARQRARVERHLATCAACQRELATLRATVELLHQVPAKPVPRSFVLPASVQSQQARYKFWSTAYSALRASTVAVALMLVLFLSSDALIGMRAIMPSQPARIAQPVVQEAADAPREVAQAAEAARPAGEPTPSKPAVEKPAEKAARVVVAPTGVPSVAATAKPEDAKSAEPTRGVAAAPRAFGISPEALPTQTVGAAAAPARISSGDIAAPTAVQEAAPQPGRMLPTPASALPMATPTSPATIAPEAAEPARMLPQVAEQASIPQTQTLWHLWQIVRILSALSAGLLLMLLAGTIWADSKRK